MELIAVVLITEIMYNPASNESWANDVEWVEIYNPGDEPLDISGWYLQDKDGATAPLPNETIIKPHTAIVLIPGTQTVEVFRAAWGKGFDVYPLKKWSRGGLTNLSNNPSAKNEILTLHDRRANVIDKVNYDDKGDWPGDSPHGPSIYLLPDALNTRANDLGKSWRRSTAKTDGAFEVKNTDDYDGADVGSPGVVTTPK